MSVKLSTSRLRTAPGMGKRSGCYLCGQEGHWSKDCPLDQNGTESNSGGYGASRFAGRGHDRVYRGFEGDPELGGDSAAAYDPVHGFPRGPGYGAAAGHETAVGYGVAAGYGAAADHGMARMYGSEAAYGSAGGSVYGAVPAYPMRRASYDDRDPYGVVDFYEKYRAHPYGAGYFEDRRSVPLPTMSPSSSAVMREHLPPANLNPYELRPPPQPAAQISTYYVRDRSPIRRVPVEADGYAFDCSRISPAPTLPRSSAYDHPREHYTF